MNIIMEALAKPVHEGRAWSDAVGVKVSLFGPLRRQVRALGQQLATDAGDLVNLLLGLFGGAETTRPLLVHLGSGCLIKEGALEQAGLYQEQKDAG